MFGTRANYAEAADEDHPAGIGDVVSRSTLQRSRAIARCDASIMVVRNLVATTCRAAAPEPDIDRSRPVPASPITKLAICRARMCRKHPDSTLSGESDIVDVPVVRKSTAHQILYAFDVSVRGVKQDDRLDASRKGIQMAGNARRHYLAGEGIVCRLRHDGATVSSLPFFINDNPHWIRDTAPSTRPSAESAWSIVCPSRSILSVSSTCCKRERILANATPSKAPDAAAAIWLAPYEKPSTNIRGELEPQ